MTEQPIDAVITWVDGNDPNHKDKMAPYLNAQFGVQNNNTLPEDLAGTTRFRTVGEIYFCLASFLRFAPFIRKIFIVTDGQDPQIDFFLRHNFPHNTIPIELVDHKSIFRGNEQVLPVFNSLSIETVLYRIPGLSEQFVYLNDDVFLVRPTIASDWFQDHKAVAYGKWMWGGGIKLLRLFKSKKSFGFKDSIVNSLQWLPKEGYCFKIDHTPHALLKSVLQEFFEQHPKALKSNIGHRFRHHTQFNPQALFYTLALRNGKAIRNSINRSICMKPSRNKNNYIARKKKNVEKENQIKFICINSLDLASHQEQEEVRSWLSSLYNITL